MACFYRGKDAPPSPPPLKVLKLLPGQRAPRHPGHGERGALRSRSRSGPGAAAQQPREAALPLAQQQLCTAVDVIVATQRDSAPPPAQEPHPGLDRSHLLRR